MNKPLVSVIIPTFNEEKDIPFCIDSLKKQTFKNLEIIVVDDGSRDSTVKIVKSMKKVKLLIQSHLGPGSARNLGAHNAKGKILVFVDADMTFDKEYIENLIKPLVENKEIIGTTHDNEIVLNINNIWSECWGKIRVSPSDAKKVKIFRAIRKVDFLSRGGFDPKYGYADDQTLWFKYGLKPVVAHKTICYHKNPDTLRSVYKQSRWIGASLSMGVLKIPIISQLFIIISIFISPIAIFYLSIKKCFKFRKISLLIPLLVFMTARYLGSIEGIIMKIYMGLNTR